MDQTVQLKIGNFVDANDVIIVGLKVVDMAPRNCYKVQFGNPGAFVTEFWAKVKKDGKTVITAAGDGMVEVADWIYNKQMCKEKHIVAFEPGSTMQVPGAVKFVNRDVETK
jgi:hypothetical protein